MPEPALEERISKDLAETGFPFEIQVAAALKSTGWKVNHQWYYEDVQNKPHTIDLIASKLLDRSAPSPTRLTVQLIVECKKRSKKPWVFYVGTEPYEGHDLATLAATKFATYGIPQISDLFPLLLNGHYFIEPPPFSVIALEAFSKGKNEATHEAITQVLMATRYEKSRIRKLLNNVSLGGHTTSAVILYPLIVLDGKMFSASVNSGEGSVQAVSRVLHQTQHGDDTYWVDVVTWEGLPSLLASVEGELQRYLNDSAPEHQSTQRPV